MPYGIEYMVVMNLLGFFILGTMIIFYHKELTIQTLSRIIKVMLLLSFVTFIILTIRWYWQ